MFNVFVLWPKSLTFEHQVQSIWHCYVVQSIQILAIVIYVIPRLISTAGTRTDGAISKRTPQAKGDTTSGA